MINEKKQDFTRRLSLCNRGELIVIIYDIYFSYVDDAKNAYNNGEHEEYKKAIRKAQNALTQLMGALNFSYELSNNLYSLYLYSKNCLSRALYENNLGGIELAQRVMTRLYESFVEVAKNDDSEPLMQNTQQVYVGITYGRTSLNENLTNENRNRGFLA